MLKSLGSDLSFPEVVINLYKPNSPVTVPLVDNRVATRSKSPNFVRHVTFDVSGTMLEGNLRSGQSFGIVPPGTREDGRPHKLRLYSVSSPTAGEDGKGKLVSTVVKRVIEENEETGGLYLGICSNYLCDLKIGTEVLMTGPSGKKFLLPEHPEDFNYVFFAAGTGIAPFRGMTMDLLKQGIRSETALIFGCGYRTDLLYADYFEQMAKEHRHFHYLTSISREDLRPDGTKPYVQYQILDNRELLYPLLAKDNTLIYVCGLKGMETGIYRMLSMVGLQDYIRISDELKTKDPAKWTEDEIKKEVKPGDRMFLEVY